MADEQNPSAHGPLSGSTSLFAQAPTRESSTSADSDPAPESNPQTNLSTFERIVSSHPPISESLLLQSPTSSILNLYHTSKCLRRFLQEYPISWKHLSFRSPNPQTSTTRQPTTASGTSGNSAGSSSKLYALNLLLLEIVLPFGTRLKSLELDHTAVAGESLAHSVLHTRRDTLQHLSIRGCKQVSLKYHIVPFLNIFKLQTSSSKQKEAPGLALKSLYTFRCMHHRRRPYTPSSLVPKESDSASTHDLIELCHELGIWTDTAWCPTPGARCLRRKDYSTSKGTVEAKNEVWVVFDRLWRSDNRLGPSNHGAGERMSRSNEQLWELETGCDGEPLGCDAEGKGLPAHLRRSHLTFVDNVSCHDCKIRIQERCEHCSIRMHCVGCRKTLCQDCAFRQPLPSATHRDGESREQFWWAPGAVRNPNRMVQEKSILNSMGTSPGIGQLPNSMVPPPIKLQSCCLRPRFSNSGSVRFSGPFSESYPLNLFGDAPLPQGQGYEDPEFGPIESNNYTSHLASEDKPAKEHQQSLKPTRSLQSLLQIPEGAADKSYPRNLCSECWHTERWKADCKACKQPICFAHDVRRAYLEDSTVNVRICGYKDLNLEKSLLEEESRPKKVMLLWKEFADLLDIPPSEGQQKFRSWVREQSLSPQLVLTLEAMIPHLSWPLATRDALVKELDAVISKIEHDTSLKSKACSLDSNGNDTEGLPSPPGNPEHPNGKTSAKEWKGCNSLICPKERNPSDHRPKCTATARQCVSCAVHVCSVCLFDSSPCDCPFCKDHYRCPNCVHVQKGLCRKAAENDAKRIDQLEMEAFKAETKKLMDGFDEESGNGFDAESSA